MEYSDSQPTCGFLRRLGAMTYDGILLFAVLFLATALLLPFTHGAAIRSGNYFYLVYLLLISYLYFAWQWTHGGQTLGMRAWHIRLLNTNKQPADLLMVTKRFCLALLSWLAAGLGFLWAIPDKNHRALHDRYSGTRLFLEEKATLTRAAEKTE